VLLRQNLITCALVVFALALCCYCIDKSSFVLLSRYVVACACYEDLSTDEKRFRDWQLLDYEQTKHRSQPIGSMDLLSS